MVPMKLLNGLGENNVSMCGCMGLHSRNAAASSTA